MALGIPWKGSTEVTNRCGQLRTRSRLALKVQKPDAPTPNSSLSVLPPSSAQKGRIGTGRLPAFPAREIVVRSFPCFLAPRAWMHRRAQKEKVQDGLDTDENAERNARITPYRHEREQHNSEGDGCSVSLVLGAAEAGAEGGLPRRWSAPPSAGRGQRRSCRFLPSALVKI